MSYMSISFIYNMSAIIRTKSVELLVDRFVSMGVVKGGGKATDLHKVCESDSTLPTRCVVIMSLLDLSRI